MTLDGGLVYWESLWWPGPSFDNLCGGLVHSRLSAGGPGPLIISVVSLSTDYLYGGLVH